MDGIHDMGGMDGYGKVEPEADEPVFHEPWEGRVMAMNRAMGTTGTFTIDRARFPPFMSRQATTRSGSWACARCCSTMG